MNEMNKKESNKKSSSPKSNQQKPQISQSKAVKSKENLKVKSQVNWFPQAKVSCVCGNSFVTGSTLSEIKLDICNACHPFYTGKQKLVDVEGRVERFQKRYAKFNKAKSTEKK